MTVAMGEMHSASETVLFVRVSIKEKWCALLPSGSIVDAVCTIRTSDGGFSIVELINYSHFRYLKYLYGNQDEIKIKAIATK